VGRECVEGGVEDRGQVKPKHGAQKKQRPPGLPHLITHNTCEYKGQVQQPQCKAKKSKS